MKVNRKYLSYLKSIGVSYIFGGKEKINVIDTLEDNKTDD